MKRLRTKGMEMNQILWKIDIGLGYSSVVEHRGKAISQGYENGRNTLFCLDAEKGTVLWKHQYPCKKAPDYFRVEQGQHRRFMKIRFIF